RTKQIALKYNFIRAEVRSGRLLLGYVPTECDVADIFSKHAVKVKLTDFSQRLFGSK
ncbi:hypothetical protein CAPTEDRAFT_106462, partial [Capitella teleta]